MTPTPPRRLSPGKNPPINDLVITPELLAQSIVDYFRPSGRLLDPARGSGAFYRALLRHSTDVRWCETAVGRDFFAYHEPVDWVIGNPPWSKFKAFIHHAMELAPNVVFLGTIVHFTTKARLRIIEAAGFGVTEIKLVQQPPPPWPGSGFQLAAVRLRKGDQSIFTPLEERAA
jgi:hypothetical protein